MRGPPHPPSRDADSLASIPDDQRCLSERTLRSMEWFYNIILRFFCWQFRRDYLESTLVRPSRSVSASMAAWGRTQGEMPATEVLERTTAHLGAAAADTLRRDFEWLNTLLRRQPAENDRAWILTTGNQFSPGKHLLQQKLWPYVVSRLQQRLAGNLLQEAAETIFNMASALWYQDYLMVLLPWLTSGEQLQFQQWFQVRNTFIHVASPMAPDEDKRFLPGTGSRRDSAKMLSVWDVSEQDLVSAAKEGRVSEVEKILRRPQSPNVTDEYGETPLGHAVCAGHLEVVRVLLKAWAHTDRPGRMSPCLHAASELGHLDIVRLLLEKKSDKNAQDRVGSTALTRAATAGQLEIVRLLVSARADIDKFDRLNGTALKYAASKGHAQIVRFLLSKKADISTADWLGMTAVRWASCRGHTEARQLLVDAGADESGYVPTRFVMCVFLIFLLCTYGFSSLLRRLLVAAVVPSLGESAFGDTCPG
ncbi:Ankrd17 [Symbiodinium sp. KB8]|nr:Ankrd17 [Symbiodinium sp. KB8]